MQYITRTERTDRTPVWIFSTPQYNTKINSKDSLIANLRGAMIYGVIGEKIHTIANITTFSYGRTAPIPYLFKKIPTLTEMVEYKGEPLYYCNGLLGDNVSVGDHIVTLNHAPYVPASSVTVTLQQGASIFSKAKSETAAPEVEGNVAASLQAQFATIGTTSSVTGSTINLNPYFFTGLAKTTTPNITRVSSEAVTQTVTAARSDVVVKVHSLVTVVDNDVARAPSKHDVSTVPVTNSGETALYVNLYPNPVTPSTSWNRGDVGDEKFACTLEEDGSFLKISLPDSRVRIDPVVGVSGFPFNKEYYVSTFFPGPILQKEI